MRVALRSKKPYSWGLEQLGVDPDFDDVDGFESAVVSSIRQRGVIDVHPNGWGVHDGLGVKSDEIPTALKEPRPYVYREYSERVKSELEELRASEEARKLEEFEALKLKIRAFPHSTDGIAWETATEFTQFGVDDALRRGITGDDWIWKRSRFLAGFK